MSPSPDYPPVKAVIDSKPNVYLPANKAGCGSRIVVPGYTERVERFVPILLPEFANEGLVKDD